MNRGVGLNEAERVVERTEETLREVRAVTVKLATTILDSMARDTMLGLEEHIPPRDLALAPFFDDLEIGDHIRRWYRVRGSTVSVCFLHSAWRNELRLFAADGRHLEDGSRRLMSSLLGDQMGSRARDHACEFVRGLG